MSACKKCGFEISGDSLVCNQCGESAPTDLPADVPSPPVEKKLRYCAKCGAVLPKKHDSCLICGPELDEPPPPGQASVSNDTPGQASDAPEQSDTPPVQPAQDLPPFSGTQRSSDRKNGKLIAVCSSLLAVMVLTAVSVWFIYALPYLGQTGKSRAKSAIIYVDGDGRLMFKNAAMIYPEELTKDFYIQEGAPVSDLAKSSANGRYIAYLKDYSAANGGFLFLSDFGNFPAFSPSEQENPLVTNQNVMEFHFTDDSLRMVYLTAGGELCVFDFTGNLILDSGVSEIISCSGNKILYRKASNGKPYSSFCIRSILSEGDDRIIIDDDILYLADHTGALDKFIYLREPSEGIRDIIAYDVNQGVRKTLATGVDKIINADAATFTVLYQTASPLDHPLRYENLIEDEYAIADSMLHEPLIEDYPILAEFYDTYTIDNDDPDSIDNLEELAEANEEFQAAVAEYEEKLERDMLRAKIAKDISDIESFPSQLYNLRLCRNAEPENLASESLKPFDNSVLDVGNGIVVWSTSYYKMSSKIPLMEYERITEGKGLRNYLEQMTGDDIYLQQFGHEAALVRVHADGGLVRAGSWHLNEKGDGVYFTAASGNSRNTLSGDAYSLYFAPVQNGLVKDLYLVDKNVAGIVQMISGNRLLYYRNLPGGMCDLYMASGTSGELIGSEVTLLDEYFKVENDAKTLLYYDHFNVNTRSGDLFMLTKGTRQLATGVYCAYYRSDSLIYLLRDPGNGQTGLYAFGSDGLVSIDESVLEVLE